MKEKTLEKKAVTKTEILAGFLGADALVKQSNDKKEKLISFSVATNIDADTVKWTQVNLHEDLASTLEKDLKKGDFVELKGLTQAYEKKDGTPGSEFIAQEVLNHKIKASVKLTEEAVIVKGNLGQDPILKKVVIGDTERTVGLFSIATNASEVVQWQNCQVWGNKVNALNLSDLHKGDFVKVTGHLGKLYTTKSGEHKQDLIVLDLTVLKPKSL